MRSVFVVLLGLSLLVLCFRTRVVAVAPIVAPIVATKLEVAIVIAEAVEAGTEWPSFSMG